MGGVYDVYDFWDILGHSGTFWHILAHSGILWDCVAIIYENAIRV